MDALGGMMDIVSARPKGFASIEDAIAWQYVKLSSHIVCRSLTDNVTHQCTVKNHWQSTVSARERATAVYQRRASCEPPAQV